jgi:hypothetical protein
VLPGWGEGRRGKGAAKRGWGKGGAETCRALNRRAPGQHTLCSLI